MDRIEQYVESVLADAVCAHQSIPDQGSELFTSTYMCSDLDVNIDTFGKTLVNIMRGLELQSVSQSNILFFFSVFM